MTRELLVKLAIAANTHCVVHYGEFIIDNIEEEREFEEWVKQASDEQIIELVTNYIKGSV